MELLAMDHSGAGELVGYNSSLPGDGTADCSLTIGPQHMNRLGILHGGFVAMLLDNGAALAVRNFARDEITPAVSVSLSVNYIAGVKSGTVTATGRITGGGRTLKFAEAELRDQDGQLLATASGIFRMLDKR
ncbi:hypothetical protein A9Q96_05415 [Rhodobacterales bacterium 52_120_T64]|nr:hypothetical protein A9Q96_05415 [Rhodobacterales bacterium 52_120_T64]